jgi:hypothetical protein
MDSIVGFEGTDFTLDGEWTTTKERGSRSSLNLCCFSSHMIRIPELLVARTAVSYDDAVRFSCIASHLVLVLNESQFLIDKHTEIPLVNQTTM